MTNSADLPNSAASSINPSGIKILVVDDCRVTRILLQEMLAIVGHLTVLAEDGMTALQMIERENPDLILLDVSMPGMDGFETARRIRERGAHGWVPLIFLTGRTDGSAIERGVGVGGDDYMIKPINFVMLKAKLDAFCRMLGMQRQIEQKNAELEYYYQAAEQEKRIASDLMNRMIRVDMLRDPLITHWIQPAHHISGDLVAAARTPGGILHVLLADATGHGLAASINVMPVAEPFYAMTEKGFGVAAIMAEINKRVKDWLPTERFVAATLVAFDPHRKLIEVWSGGNPPPVLLDEQGVELHHFSKTHFPLGIASGSQFDPSTELFRLGRPAQLLLFSDGATEAENVGGVPFGRAALLAAMQAALPASRMQHVQDTLATYLAGTPPHDDISMVIIDCDSQVVQRDRVKPLPSEDRYQEIQGAWRIHVTLSAQELKYIDPVPMLLGSVQKFRDTNVQGMLFVIMSELFNNALDHGLLKLDSHLKDGADGMEHYLALRKSRLAELSGACIELSLEMRSENGSPMLEIMVKDSGDGFDYVHFLRADGMSDTTRHGRGIQLVKRLCTRLEYKAPGNEVKAVFDLSRTVGICPDRAENAEVLSSGSAATLPRSS